MAASVSEWNQRTNAHALNPSDWHTSARLSDSEQRQIRWELPFKVVELWLDDFRAYPRRLRFEMAPPGQFRESRTSLES